MEVRMKTELGLAKVGQDLPHQKNLENPASIPGVPSSERGLANLNREMAAIRPNQATDHYKTQGPSVNLLA